MTEPLPSHVCATLYLDELAADSSENWGKQEHCNFLTQCEATPQTNEDGIVETIGKVCLKMNKVDYRSKLAKTTF